MREAALERIRRLAEENGSGVIVPDDLNHFLAERKAMILYVNNRAELGDEDAIALINDWGMRL